MPETIVTLTEENGKCRMEGTTYIDNDPEKPWPVNVLWDTEEEARDFAEKHGYTIDE